MRLIYLEGFALESEIALIGLMMLIISADNDKTNCIAYLIYIITQSHPIFLQGALNGLHMTPTNPCYPHKNPVRLVG